MGRAAIAGTRRLQTERRQRSDGPIQARQGGGSSFRSRRSRRRCSRAVADGRRCAGAAAAADHQPPSAPRRSRVAVGKTEDVRIDGAFTDITVGDPEVADVKPLTDHSLSILGKKIGTTRVSIYGEGKKLVGIFDVEVSYDVSRLATEIRAVTGPGIKVSSVNGRIMLSGKAPDAVTLDKAVTIARQFAPDIINTVQVMRRSRSCWRCASSKPAQRRPRPRRAVERVRQGTSRPISARASQPMASANQLPITAPTSRDQHSGRRSRRGRALRRLAVRLHARAASSPAVTNRSTS